MPFDQLLAFAIPDVDRCRDAADKVRSANPQASDEQLAGHSVLAARKWAMAAGGATGMFASPVTMIPAALADMSAMLRIEAAMAGTVGAILDPPSLNDPGGFEADILTIIFPAAISQALRQVGVHMAQHLTQQLIRKYVVEGLFEAASKVAARRLMLHGAERAIVTKTVPLVGAGIGAGWNWVEIQAVGARAIRYYQRQEIGTGIVREGMQQLQSWFKRKLGHGEQA